MNWVHFPGCNYCGFISALALQSVQGSNLVGFVMSCCAYCSAGQISSTQNELFWTELQLKSLYTSWGRWNKLNSWVCTALAEDSIKTWSNEQKICFRLCKYLRLHTYVIQSFTFYIHSLYPLSPMLLQTEHTLNIEILVHAGCLEASLL